MRADHATVGRDTDDRTGRHGTPKAAGAMPTVRSLDHSGGPFASFPTEVIGASHCFY
jgi:hypothetical protein